jgi:hypothetical protein
MNKIVPWVVGVGAAVLLGVMGFTYAGSRGRSEGCGSGCGKDRQGCPDKAGCPEGECGGQAWRGGRKSGCCPNEYLPASTKGSAGAECAVEKSKGCPREAKPCGDKDCGVKECVCGAGCTCAAGCGPECGCGCRKSPKGCGQGRYGGAPRGCGAR